jgi:hypothetical protein
MITRTTNHYQQQGQFIVSLTLGLVLIFLSLQVFEKGFSLSQLLKSELLGIKKELERKKEIFANASRLNDSQNYNCKNLKEVGQYCTLSSPYEELLKNPKFITSHFSFSPQINFSFAMAKFDACTNLDALTACSLITLRKNIFSYNETKITLISSLKSLTVFSLSKITINKINLINDLLLVAVDDISIQELHNVNPLNPVDVTLVSTKGTALVNNISGNIYLRTITFKETASNLDPFISSQNKLLPPLIKRIESIFPQ